MNETTKSLGISYFLGITAIIFVFTTGIIFAITKNSPSQNSTDTSHDSSMQSSSESELSSPANNSENTTQDQENLSM